MTPIASSVSWPFRRDRRRAFYAEHLGITRNQLRKRFGDIERLDQLDACKDDAARRLLLGRSEKQKAV